MLKKEEVTKKFELLSAQRKYPTLKELRIQAEKTCEEVSELLSITPQAVYRYERGIREINLEQVVTLAKVYDVSIEDIVYAQLNSRYDR